MSEWERIHEHHEILRAPHGQARLNRWQDRDDEGHKETLIEVTTSLDELSADMARMLVEDLKWLISKMK